MKNIRLIIYFLLILINLLFASSPILLFITLFQVIYIYILIIKGKIDDAVFWHFVFTITSVSITTMLLKEGIMYGYDSYKIISSLSFSYLNTVLLLLLSIKRKIKTDNLLFRLFKLLLFLFISGIILGFIGISFGDYFLEYFFIHAFYMLMIVLNALLLLLRNSEYLGKSLLGAIIALLIFSPICTTIVYLMGFSSAYGSFDALIQTELDFYSISLLFLLPYVRNIKYKLLICVSLFCLVYNILSAGGGREIMIIMIALFIFLFLILRGNLLLSNKSLKVLKVSSIVIVSTFVYFILNVALLDKSSIFAYKMEEVISLFSMFSAKDIFELSEYVGPSLYVRIASLIDIVNDNLNSPLKLLIGNGYGGYFTDSLGMFSHRTTLEDGGWPLKYVLLGKFPYGHDSIAVVPLLNGLVGLYMIVVFAFKELKYINKNFLLFAFVPFLLISLYFCITFGVIAIVMIFTSEYYDPKYLNNEKSIIY